MPIKEDFAPYTSPGLVLEVLKRQRDFGVPEYLTVANLVKIQIPEGSASRTQQALRFLRLIEEDFRLTEAFRQISVVGDEEYKELLAEVIQSAYSQVFKKGNPTEYSDEELETAFRFYQPFAQRKRMVTLFVALCQEAGLMEGDRTAARKPLPKRPPAPVRKPSITPLPNGTGTPTQAVQHSSFLEPTPPAKAHDQYDLLIGLIKKLPESAKWTETESERWLTAFTGTLHFLIDKVPLHSTNQEEGAADRSTTPFNPI